MALKVRERKSPAMSRPRPAAARGSCPSCGRRGADNWGDSRLALTLRMLAIMPTSPAQGLTLADMEGELEVSRSKLFRLIRAFRRADLDVESCFAPSGLKVYYLPKQRQSLIDKILR